MTEIYVTLEDAAELECLKYNTLVQRISRNPENYKTQKEPRETENGKEHVLIALSSLSKTARKKHKETTKIDGGDIIVEQRTQETPWYIDIDLNWYIENNKQKYYEAVELSKQIQEYLNYDAEERTAYADEFAEKLGISQRTLYRYAQSYLEASAWSLKMEKEEGHSFDYYKPLSLCRKPKEKFTFPSLTDEQKALIENIWFDKVFASNLGTIEMLYEKFIEVADERGWEDYPSVKTVNRYIKYIMEEQKGSNAHFLQSNGLREFKNKKMIKAKRDTKSLAVMEFVQGDEHTFDCWVEYTSSNGKIKAIKPRLVAWIDTRTRCIIGDVICETPNSQVLKESLVKMIYSSPIGGVPQHLHIDNGKDYTSETNLGQNRNERVMLEFDSETKGFYRSIGIEDWSRSLPYQPWGKAQIERFFRTVCNRFTKWMASYTGTLTGSKTSDKRKKNISKMLERGELLTMEEFYELWNKWKDEKYHSHVHRGLKEDNEQYIKPAELFINAENKYIKAPPPREYASMLLMKSDEALVRNQGIYKFNTIYTDYELSKYVGEKVGIRWDIDDVTKLYVYAKDGKKICEAVSHELLKFAPGITQEALEKHIRNQNRQIKDAKKDAEWYNTPYETRLEMQNEETTKLTKSVFGGLDITIKSKHKANNSIVTLPCDKEYKEEIKARAKLKNKVDDSFFNQKADDVLKKLQALG